jgi:ParB family chromosome partitioning protein
VIQPIVVRRVESGRYQIIAGERRWRAAQRAGLHKVPIVVKDVAASDHKRRLEMALIENIQREDLNPMEEANAYHQLHDEFGMTQEEIAKRVGKERSTVANFLRLLKLPASVKAMLAGGQLSMGHARALLAMESAKKQEALAERVVKHDLSVRQTEMLASEKPAPKKKEKIKDVHTRDAENKLQRALRTKVEIDRKRSGGVIHISFGSEDELIRVVDDLMGRRRT